MKPSKALYAAADYIRECGFEVGMGRHGGCRCMIGALESVGAFDPRRYELDGPARDILESVVGGDLLGATLAREGWQADDAIAALQIAADIAFEEERHAAQA